MVHVLQALRTRRDDGGRLRAVLRPVRDGRCGVGGGTNSSLGEVHRLLDHSWIGVDATEVFWKATSRPVAVMNHATRRESPRSASGAGRGQDGVVAVVTLGPRIGSARVIDGTPVPNSGLGHRRCITARPSTGLPSRSASRTSRRAKKEKYAHRLPAYPELVRRVLWPHPIIIGRGISKKADKFLPLIELRTPIAPAQLHNDAESSAPRSHPRSS